MVKVKICGITSVEDACAAADAGADWIGLNFASVSKRRVAVDVAARIVQAVVPRVEVVGVFVNQPPAEVGTIAATTGLRMVQLHGDEQAWEWRDFPLPVIRAVRIAGERLPSWEDFPARYILVDRYQEGAYGGTGQTLAWEKLRDQSWPLPLILAGGLNPDNVRQAIRCVRPFAVDVASGVERAPGKKDPELMRRFVEHAKTA